MKARIVSDVASVYEEPDVESPIVGALEPTDLFHFGEVAKGGRASWVHVLLADGVHGYLEGETRLQVLEALTPVGVEAAVRQSPSDDAPEAIRLRPGERFFAGAIPPTEGKAWVRVYDERCRALGFLSADAKFQPLPRDQTIATLPADGTVAAVSRAVEQVLRDEKWNVSPRPPEAGRRTIRAACTPNPLNRTNLLNATVGLLRFCIWPLISKVNSKAKIFPAPFVPSLSVEAVVNAKGAGSVVLLSGTTVSFLGTPLLHSRARRLRESLKARLQGPIAETPDAPPLPPAGEVQPPAPAVPSVGTKSAGTKSAGTKSGGDSSPAGEIQSAAPVVAVAPRPAPVRPAKSGPATSVKGPSGGGGTSQAAATGPAKVAGTGGLLTVKCSKCGGRDRVPRAAVGKGAKCNTCGHVFRIVIKKEGPAGTTL